MVDNLFIHRSALFVTLSFCLVVSATDAVAQQADKSAKKQAQPTLEKQASQKQGKAKAKPKEAKPAQAKAKTQTKQASPDKTPPNVAKTKAKPKKDAPVSAAAEKKPSLVKSKQTARVRRTAGKDKAKAVETKKAKAEASRVKPEEKKPVKAATKVDFQKAKALLASAESDKVKKGLKHLAAIGKPTITAPIVARLRQGLPPALTESAVEALVKAKNASKAAPALIELCEHRRAAIRASALSALGELKVRKAYNVVRDALDDADASVRAAAATALSQVGGRKALKDLYQVFESGDTDVVSEIAKWVTTRDADKLTGYLKDHSFHTLQPAFVEIFNKKSTSVRDKSKLISRLGEVGTPDIQAFLREYLNNLPDVGRKPLMDAIGKALQSAQTSEAAETDTETKQNKKSASKNEEAK